MSEYFGAGHSLHIISWTSHLYMDLYRVLLKNQWAAGEQYFYASIPCVIFVALTWLNQESLFNMCSAHYFWKAGLDDYDHK